MTCRTKGPRRALSYSIQNVGDKWETSGRQMSMTCRTKGPRRALQHPECGRQIEDKWETNEYDVWNQGAQTSVTASRMWETNGRQVGDK